jgi:Na+:H+ antiporter, NhaA family
MSLFITLLAFDDAGLVGAAKLGILAGSLFAGIVAAMILKTTGRKK